MIIFESSHTQYSHLGASCSNMGRIRTKENIAVDTHLIGKVPSSLGGCLWSYLNHSVTPLRTDVDRIRISVVKQFSESLGGFLFKHGSYSNPREHSCRYPLHWHRHTHWGLYDRIRILA